MVKMYLSKLAPFWISTQPTDTPWQPFISDQANIGPKLNWRETTTLKIKPYNLGDLSKNYFVSSPLLQWSNVLLENLFIDSHANTMFISTREQIFGCWISPFNITKSSIPTSKQIFNKFDSPFKRKTKNLHWLLFKTPLRGKYMRPFKMHSNTLQIKRQIYVTI